MLHETFRGRKAQTVGARGLGEVGDAHALRAERYEQEMAPPASVTHEEVLRSGRARFRNMLQLLLAGEHRRMVVPGEADGVRGQKADEIGHAWKSRVAAASRYRPSYNGRSRPNAARKIRRPGTVAERRTGACHAIFTKLPPQ
jgi:hypothetical protein